MNNILARQNKMLEKKLEQLANKIPISTLVSSEIVNQKTASMLTKKPSEIAVKAKEKMGLSINGQDEDEFNFDMSD
jgi:hypothetical protein